MDAAGLCLIYQVTWRDIAEDPSLNIHRCETLKFRISYKVCICWDVPKWRERVSCLFAEGLFNPLNAELIPICHLLALLGAHPILHVSRIRVNWRTAGWRARI